MLYVSTLLRQYSCFYCGEHAKLLTFNLGMLTRILAQEQIKMISTSCHKISVQHQEKIRILFLEENDFFNKN